MNRHHAYATGDLPYSFAHLDDLMEAASLDVLVATSKHNVQYLLGGYRFSFFAAMDAIGHSRYLPVFVYVRGAVDKTAYIASKMESGEHENHPFWVPHFHPVSWGSVDCVQAAMAHSQGQRAEQNSGFSTGGFQKTSKKPANDGDTIEAEFTVLNGKKS